MTSEASRALRRGVAAAAAALVAASPAAAQEPPPGAQFGEELSISWILVPVTVKSRAGYVRGLDRDDFVLKVDGRRVDFPDFEPRAEVPWSLVFLQDLSGSMANGGRIEASRAAARYFLANSRPGDEFAVAGFAGDQTWVEVPFTEQVVPVFDAVARWRPYGKTAIHDAVAMVPQISSESRNIKRAAILITDGVDNASRYTPEQARAVVRRADVPVYVIGIQSGDPPAEQSNGARVYRYAEVLNLLAAETGGRYFPVEGPDDVKEACATIAEELRWQYVLGFETSGRGAVRRRSISVEVRKRAVEVVTRSGYRGTAPARR